MILWGFQIIFASSNFVVVARRSNGEWPFGEKYF